MATLLKATRELLSDIPDEPGSSTQQLRLLWVGLRSRDLLYAVDQLLEARGFAQRHNEIFTHQVTAVSGWKKAAPNAELILGDLPSLLEREPETYDIVVVMPNKDRTLTYLWADSALAQLKVGGHIIVAGGKREGVEPLEKRMAEITTPVCRHIGKPVGRLSLYKKVAATNQPAVAWEGFELDAQTRIDTLPGVFSKKKFDAGTLAIIEALEVKPGERFLDLACGPGTVGLTMLQQEPSLRVVLSDEDANAVACAKANASRLTTGVEKVVLADGMDGLEGEKFDVIALNPPFHQGQGVGYAMAQRLCEQASRALNPGGRFYMVANSFCPYEEFLEKFFSNVEELGDDRRYRIWLCS